MEGKVIQTSGSQRIWDYSLGNILLICRDKFSLTMFGTNFEDFRKLFCFSFCLQIIVVVLCRYQIVVNKWVNFIFEWKWIFFEIRSSSQLWQSYTSRHMTVLVSGSVWLDTEISLVVKSKLCVSEYIYQCM